MNRDTRPTIGAATLTAGPYDVVLRQVALSMTATGAESFVLRRRLSSATDWETVASGIEPVEGAGSFVDTVPAPGPYIYMAVGMARGFEGPASPSVSVTAT